MFVLKAEDHEPGPGPSHRASTPGPRWQQARAAHGSCHLSGGSAKGRQSALESARDYGGGSWIPRSGARIVHPGLLLYSAGEVVDREMLEAPAHPLASSSDHTAGITSLR